MSDLSEYGIQIEIIIIQIECVSRCLSPLSQFVKTNKSALIVPSARRNNPSLSLRRARKKIFV